MNDKQRSRAIDPLDDIWKEVAKLTNEDKLKLFRAVAKQMEGESQ